MIRARNSNRKKKRSGDPRWDRFSDKAKREGYAARSVYKLQEIDERFGLLKQGMHVLDLGCHPGSWLKYAAQRVGGQGRVLGIDRTPTKAPAANAVTLEADLTDPLDPAALGGGFDAVLSDMAPDTTGIRHVDQDRSALLAEIAMTIAQRHGKAGSALVIKIFQGPDFHPLLARAKSLYDKVRCVRPEATRKQSIEVYIVATGKYEPGAADD